MDANPGPAVWILLLSTAALQRAFAKSAQPVLVAGSLYEDVRLPAWDIDHAAACRHAVGRFLAKGHRRIALVTGRQPLGGGLRSETGFREAIAAAGGDVEGMVTYYAEHVEGLCTALDRLLVRPRPPTAFLVCRPGYTLAAHGYLIRRGLRFPETAALIGRDHDWHLNYAIPSIAHYRVFPKVEAGAINRLLLDLIAGGNPPARQHLLIPEFVPGDTLG